jgi:lysophospholipase L1-like esterase
VLLGANDAMLPIPTARQSVPLEEYRANLKAIITHPNITAHSPKVLLVTPPPIDELAMLECDMAKGMGQLSRSARNTSKYAQVAREIAADVPGTMLIDLWRAVRNRAVELTPDWVQEDGSGKPWLGTLESGTRGGFKTLLTDGLHMDHEAYKLLFGLVSPHILVDDNREDHEKDVFPPWWVLNKAKTIETI